MSTYSDTYSVTDLRHNTSEVLEQAIARGYVYLIKNSKRKAALVDADYLTALLEAYEDYMDTLEFDKAIKEKGKISLSDYKKKFNE